MRQVDVEVDVSDAVGTGERLHTAATVHLTDEPVSPVTVVFAFPGGGYHRSYYDARPDGDASYSQALDHTDKGMVVVGIDHLAVGDSTMPADPLALTFEHCAAANAATVAEVLQRLEAGTLGDGVAAVRVGLTVGIGQSMGGCFLTVQQGLHHTFDAVAMLGWSAIQTSFPSPSGKGRVVSVAPPWGTDLHTITEAPFSFTDAEFRYCFHYDDVIGAVVDADMAAIVDPSAPLPSWRSASTPPVAMTMVHPGVVADDAAAIDVPVFVAAGERDVMADPRAEPAAYRSSPDITVAVFPRMSHMHNFAGTRQQLWDRLTGWIAALSPR